MKRFIRILLLVLVLTAMLLALSGCQVQPAELADTSAPPLSEEDLVVVAMIAAIGGAILSYILNTIKGARELFDKLSPDAKPIVLAVFFIVVTGALAALNCYNLYSSAVTCPAGPPDYFRLLFLALVAWSGSQVAHTVGGGKQLAAANRYRLMNAPSLKG